MPNTGTPIDNTPVSHGGAPASYTEFGPPDNTTPAGSNFRISSTLAVQGSIALNTCCSRIRRAISCVYCPPKSSTTIPPRSLIVSSYGLRPCLTNSLTRKFHISNLKFRSALRIHRNIMPHSSALCALCDLCGEILSARQPRRPPFKSQISNFLKHLMHRLTRPKRLQIRPRTLPNSHQRLAAVERIMRREDHVLPRKQHAIPNRRAQPLHVHRLLQQLVFFLNQFLSFEHVQPRAAQSAVFQRSHQRVRIHEAPARSVDQQ